MTTLLVPLLMLGGMGALVWMLQAPQKSQTQSSPAAPKAIGWEVEEISPSENGKLPAGWEAPRGNFVMETKDGQPVVSLQPEPMVEGRIILQKLLRGGGGIRARLSGERAPRAFPRFGVGLQGKSASAGEGKESTFQLRATPGLKKLEFIEQFAEQDHARAEAPWTWREGVPLWLEIRAQPAAEGCSLEGRAWAEGEARPETASISLTVPLNPSLMKATIHATPFALKPVVIEKVERISGGATGADES